MTITIPELAPSLNGSRGLMRMHWASYKKIRDRWTYLVKAEANGHRFKQAEVRIRRYYSRQPLDLDNLYAASKIPLDALRHARVLPDDDPQCVTALRVTQEKVETVSDERTVIELT